MTATTLEGKYLTVSEVQNRTRLAERTIRTMIADGRLPCIRLAGVRRVRVPAEAVASLMAGRRDTEDREPPKG